MKYEMRKEVHIEAGEDAGAGKERDEGIVASRKVRTAKTRMCWTLGSATGKIREGVREVTRPAFLSP